MCIIPKAKTPVVTAPAAAPPPPAMSAGVEQASPDNPATDGNAATNAARRGRNALKIPLGGTGTGLNIPQ